MSENAKEFERILELEKSILESIHGISYDQIEKQGKENFGAMVDPFVESSTFDITLCRVLQALLNLGYEAYFNDLKEIVIRDHIDVEFCSWKLLNDDMSPATVYDQSENVIQILRHIFLKDR